MSGLAAASQLSLFFAFLSFLFFSVLLILFLGSLVEHWVAQALVRYE